jgi:hypothetical protein
MVRLSAHQAPGGQPMKAITAPQKLFVSPRVESVRLRLERWRRNRKHRSPLRLDYYSLKERLGPGNQPISPEAKTQPAFVELVPQAPAAISECTVELEDPTGTRMRVQIKGTALPDLTGLSDAFWRARR